MKKLLSIVILAVLATAFGISSCRPDFDLDKRMPEWLGTSIYQTLQEGFRNDSTGEFYSFKTFVRLIEDLNQVDILAKTGSKTLFVADDKAFERFFKDCPFVDANGNKITSYEQLSKAQKAQADTYFDKFVFPVLTPLAVDTSRPFPLLANKSLNIAVRLKRDGEDIFAACGMLAGKHKQN